MGAAKGRDPLTRAGQQVAKGRAGISAETLDYLILSHRISALTCASRFMQDEDVPCYDLQDRRAHAAAALFVEDFLSTEGRDYTYDAEMLGRIVASWMHAPYCLGHRIVRALVDAGLLAVEVYRGAAC